VTFIFYKVLDNKKNKYNKSLVPPHNKITQLFILSREASIKK